MTTHVAHGGRFTGPDSRLLNHNKQRGVIDFSNISSFGTKEQQLNSPQSSMAIVVPL